MKKFVSGMLTGALICSSATVALAASGSQQLEAFFRDIKVAVNGDVASLTDANGNKVEPFIVNGTTYLPVRAVASALGQEVSWNGDTNTVYIGKQPTPAATTQSTPANTVIYDDNGVKVTYLGTKRENANTDYASNVMSFKLENSNDVEYTVYADDKLIDNVQCYSGIANSVLPNSVTYADLTFYDDMVLEYYRLSSFNSISFKLKCYASDDSGQITFSDKITIVK